MALGCLSMVAFGMVMASLGASLPVIIARFGIDKRQAGGLLALLSLSILPGSLVFGPVVDRRGYKGILISSFAAIAVGLETIAFAPSLVWLRTGILLTGFSGGIVNGASNALVADVSGDRRGATLTLVGGFFGVGAAGVPLLLALLAGNVSHAAILAAAGALVVLPLVMCAIVTFPPPKHPQAFPIEHARALLRDPVLLVMGLILFFESGMESTVGGWTTTFFNEELGVAVERAPLYLAFFWLGLMVTRLALGLLSPRRSSMRVLFVAMGLTLASALWLVWTRNLTAAGLGVFLMGCGFAPIYPAMYGFVGDRHPRVAGTALSLVIAMGLTGGMLLPYLAGVVGAARGLRTSFLIVPLSLILVATLLTVVARNVSPSPATGPLGK